jgi:hypothetical protein
MKTLKVIGLIIWGFLTISLFIYGSTMRQKVEAQKTAIDELIVGMSDIMDTTYVGDMLLHFKNEIDSLEKEIIDRDSLISNLNEK